MITDQELSALEAMSARVGADPLLVQGAGGNTSIKDTDELWVKASGMWLAEAGRTPSFVPLAIRRLRDTDGAPYMDAPPDAVISARNPGGLRPSIETMLHALLPHRVVIHAHSVNAMTVSVLVDGPELADDRLASLHWRWIGYHRPGAPLAAAVAATMADGPADVLVLQNHGIVVGADTIEAAEAILINVEARLHLFPRPLAIVDRATVERFANADYEFHEQGSSIAIEDASFRTLTGTALVPDQIVFLGGPVAALQPAETVEAAVSRTQASIGVMPPLLFIPGHGAVARRDRSTATEAMIGGLIEVARRVPDGMAVRGLSAGDIAQLSTWDAEHYRQALDRARTLAGWGA